MKRCKFNIYRLDSWTPGATEILVEITGYEVEVLGLRCFVDKRKSQGWTITEALSGFAFAHGDTRAEAIIEAKERLQELPSGLLMLGLIKAAHLIGAKGLPWPVNKLGEA